MWIYSKELNGYFFGYWRQLSKKPVLVCEPPHFVEFTAMLTKIDTRDYFFKIKGRDVVIPARHVKQSPQLGEQGKLLVSEWFVVHSELDGLLGS